MLGGIAVLAAVIGVGSAVAATVLAFALGVALLPDADPFVLMLVWDGVIAGFLLLWIVGLLMQLQLGGERLSLEKLLHLPISPASAFLLNLVSSQARISLLICFGIMLGLAVASATALGAAHLILVPLVLAFVAFVASVTYQFQSWLARVAADKRRRTTVVAAAGMAFPVLFSLPVLLNRLPPEVDISLQAVAQVEPWMLLGNTILPPGWLAVGAWGVARGQIWIGALASFGMGGMAALSLRRSYRKTLAALAQADRRRRPSAPVPSIVARQEAASSRARTTRLPGLPRLIDRFAGYVPHESRGVAWVAMRVWSRSPQGKMALLSPLMLIILYVLVVQNMAKGAPQFAVPAMLGFMIMGAFNLFSNLFGQDGNGFRAVMLGGVGAKQLLLGKNLALLPYVLAVGSVMIVVLQWVHPLPASHVVANVVQLCVLYFVACMLGNSFSIRLPWAMSTSSMRTRNATATAFLATFLILPLLFIAILPLALPLWIEARLAEGGIEIPVYLFCSVLEAAVVGLIYRRLLASQGRLLAQRMETVLDRVTQPP